MKRFALSSVLLLAACGCPEEFRRGVFIPSGDTIVPLDNRKGVFLTLRGSERISDSQLRDMPLFHMLVLAPGVETRGGGSELQLNCLRAKQTVTWKLGHYQRGPFDLPDQEFKVWYDGESKTVKVGEYRYDALGGNVFIVTLDSEWRLRTVQQLPIVRYLPEKPVQTIAALRAAVPLNADLQSTKLYGEPPDSGN